MPARTLSDPSLGKPSRPRHACTSCSQFVYLDEIEREPPLPVAEYVLKRDCPRKPRCQPWKDRGCAFVNLAAGESYVPPAPVDSGSPPSWA